MADVDTSIYRNTVAPLDPLKTYGQVLGIQGAQQQNKLLQQQTDMRTGLGDAYRQAVGSDGKVDQNRLIAIIGGDPRTAGFTGDINAQAQSNVTATAQAQKAQLENGIAHIRAVNAAGSALISNPALGKADMHDAIAQSITDLSNHGDSLMTGKIAKATIDSIPLDPAGQLQWVQQKMAENDAYAGQFKETYERTFGASGAQSTGQQIVGTKQDMRSGAISSPAQQGVPLVVDPGTAGSKVDWTDVSGQVHQGTYAQYATEHGMGHVVGAARPSAAAPAAGPALGTPNRLAAKPVVAPPGTTGQPMAPPAPAPPAAAPRQSGYVDTLGPAPGTVAAAAAPAEASGNMLATDRAYQAGNQARTYQATAAIKALRSTDTGPGTEWRQNFVSAALATPLAGPLLAKLGALDPKSIEAYDEANKLLARNAADQLSGTGAPSDARQGLITTANASTHISNAAAQNVMIMNVGLDRLKSAAVKAFDGTGLPAAQYSKWVGDWMKTQDPRAYGVDQMTTGDRNDLVNGMKKTEKERFLQSGRTGVALGYIPHSSTMQ